MKLVLATVAALAICAVGNVIDVTQSEINVPPKFEIANLPPQPQPPVKLTTGDGDLIGSPSMGYDHDIADEATRTRYTKKGGALMCMLRSSDEYAGTELKDTRNPPSAASVWQGDLQNELATWYWYYFDAKEHYHGDLDGYWYLSNALSALGLNTRPASEGGHNKAYHIEHWDPSKKDSSGMSIPGGNQRYQVNGKEYRATKANFEFTINTIGGAIYAQYLNNPANAVREYWGRSASPSELPALRSLSDVLWGFWNRDNSNVKNIRYYIVKGIVNEVTRELLGWILLQRGEEMKVWPGLTLGMEGSEGRALLGSPIGATLAYFLIQHKAQLGNKVVSKVTVVIPENEIDEEFDPEHDPTFIFHVEDGGEADVGAGNGGEIGDVMSRRTESAAVRAMDVSGNSTHIVRVHSIFF